MSFADLRAARKSKESSSYVTNTPHIATETPPSEDVQINKVGPALILDGLYKSLPPHLDLRTSPASGRGLWAKGYVNPGDILLSVKPHIAALSNQNLHSSCSNCFGPAPESGLRRCTKCRVVSYCDSACQNKDWPLHKHECPAIQRWAESAPSADLAIPSDAVRCLGRMLWKRQKLGSASDWVREINSMQSHRLSLQPSAFELHTHLAHALVRYLGISSSERLSEFGFSSAGNIVDIISRFVTNTFSVTTPSLTPIGASISPLIALINHSCDPNAVVVFPRTSSSPATQEPLMQVIALRQIAPDEEILTSYIDTTPPRSSRQKTLQETYHFTCNCDLCLHPPGVDPREAMWCPKSCGGTCPVPTEEDSFTRCTKCKAVAQKTDEVLDAMRVGQEALDKATALQFKDPAKSTQLTTNLIPILASAGLTPSSHPLLALARLHQSLLIESLPLPPTQDALDECIRAATRSSAGLSGILREGHPMRGIALAELGKMLAVDEPEPRAAKAGGGDGENRLGQAPQYPPSGPQRLKLAYETLLKARAELMVGFGARNEGGMVGRDVRENAVALEKELGVWKQGVRNVLEDRPREVKR